MKAYVIALPETVDESLSRIRRRHIESQLAEARLPHQFVASVDGWRLTPPERACLVDESAVAQHPTWFKPGLIGAALSHVQAYREILAAGESAALVLEDDATLGQTINEEALDEVADRMTRSEVVLLYWRSWPGCEFSAFAAQELGGDRRLMYPMDPHKLTAAAAYVITRKACETMIQALLPIRVGPDAWGTFHEWRAFESVRCVVPRALRTETDFKSTLGYLEPVGAAGRLSAFVAHKRIFPVYQFLGWRRSRLERSMSAFDVVEQPSPLAGTVPDGA